jgi:hypothetical protein
MINDYNHTLPNLELSILGKVRILEKRRLFLQRGFYSGVSSVSLLATIFSLKYINDTLVVSGVCDYISMVFYDYSVVYYWKELLLSIAESLPFLTFALAMSVVSLFMWSTVKSIKIYDIRY